MGKSQDLYKKAKKIIPGGTQLLSKRPEMFLPDLWPAYYQKAKGCEIWDLDGKKYIDMSLMGVGACILGYADRGVDRVVKKAIDNGSMTTLNCPEEIELAKLLLKIHPWAQMVRYSRTGGEAMSMAVRITRYLGWHDWYLSSNLADDKALDGHLLPGLEPKGVPRCLKSSAIPFKYNDINKFLALIKKYKHKIGVVVMEPIRNYYPKKGFLEKIRKITKDLDMILIFDEVSSGWRLTLGGAHLKLGVNPDIAVFAKGMSNGYPMAATIGRKEIMDIVQDTFISSTYWTERVGPVAALACIRKMKRLNVSHNLIKIGKKIQKTWKNLAKKHALKIKITGIYSLSHFEFEYKDPLILKTLFTQLMLKEGFLASTGFYASFAHKKEHISKYSKAIDKTFLFISKAIKAGRPEKYLKGPVCHAGFKRLN